MAKASKKLTIVSLLVLPAILGGCFLAPQGQNTNEAVNTNQEDLPSEASAQEGWKTYRNEEYGFEFKYPLESGRFPGAPPHKVILQDDGFLIANTAFIKIFQTVGNNPETYIRNILLQDADQDCTVKVFEDASKLPEGYTGYSINMLDSNGDERVISIVDDIDCTEYAGRGQVAYFMHNINIPDKILYIIRYQDPSMSMDQFSKFIKSVRILK